MFLSLPTVDLPIPSSFATARRELNDKIVKHIGYVEDRDFRNVNLKELIAVAVKAVTDGYHEGIAVNVGRVIGTGHVRGGIQ